MYASDFTCGEKILEVWNLIFSWDIGFICTVFLYLDVLLPVEAAGHKGDSHAVYSRKYFSNKVSTFKLHVHNIWDYDHVRDCETMTNSTP